MYLSISLLLASNNPISANYFNLIFNISILDCLKESMLFDLNVIYLFKY